MVLFGGAPSSWNPSSTGNSRIVTGRAPRSRITVVRSAGTTTPTTLEEFARGAQLRFQRKGALQTVLVPISVYRSSVESGLADLRVFNAAGEAVPHAIRVLGRSDPDDVLSDPLPFYRLPDDPADGSVVISPDGLREVR